MPGDAISKAELFDRLAEGHAARITVLTPNRRLAQELAREFDTFQIAKSLTVWEDADILPFGAFVERLWEDALYSEIAAELPMLLAPEQERELWEQVIAASEWSGKLLAPAQAAAQCADAWRLAHAWRIAGALGKFPGNEDAQAFESWARTYEARTAAGIDSARLTDSVARLLGEIALRKPKLLVACAFDILPPQTEDFFRACGEAGIELRTCGAARKPANPVRVPFASAREELEAAARWARARLEALTPSPLPSPGVGSGERVAASERGEPSSSGRGEPSSSPLPQGEGSGERGEGSGERARIGVVVPDLGERRKEVVRVFSRVMQPGRNLPGAKPQPMPFNVSLGAPLADYPIVLAALGILELSSQEIEFAAASRLIRSPFIGGAESEMARRARLDAELRRKLPPRVALAKLVGRADTCPILRARLEALFSGAKSCPAGKRSPYEWGAHCTALLEAVGFPGERALDSDEFQARAKFNETLAEFARLERVARPMDFAEALARLRRMCAATLFQPESPDAPVQVLGILESAGLEFDHLWVSGLTDEAWPLHARPNPFIPVALQKKAGVPEASAEGSLALDRRITEGWFGAASEAIVSHALREQDRELLPSPLIVQVPEAKIALPQVARYRDILFSSLAFESVPDGKAPPLPAPPAGEGPGERGAAVRVRGGTRVLADQAACPFRAFARHRLGAEGLEAPAEQPDARARGQLLHTLMARLWGELKTSDALTRDVAPAIERAAAAAVAEAGLEGQFAALERERLARLAREWLEVERTRDSFEVLATEEPRELAVGGLALRGRIDRMDRLADGSHLLIDYKTGRQLSPRLWMGERPDEPQLPLYAVTAKEDISAVAFAKLRHGEMRFMGYARDKDAVPKVTLFEGWDSLLAGWRAELDALGRGFAAGEARVDPKDGLKTCRTCDLQPLCRVHERVSPLSLEGRGAGGEGDAEDGA